MSASKEFLIHLAKAGFRPHPTYKGVLVSKKHMETITAASLESAAEAMRDVTAYRSTEDTGEYNEAREKLIREWMEAVANYAEDGQTFDPEGNYLCNTCKFRELRDYGNENKCYIVEGTTLMNVGTCDRYVNGNPDSEVNPLPILHKLSQAHSGYAERPEAKGFGCSRCEYSTKAKKQDAEGRESWCKMFGVHIQSKACCAFEDGKDLVMPYDKKVEAATETSQAGDRAGSLWNGIRLVGFTGPEEEALRAMMSRVPPELLGHVTEVKSAKELNAKHGRFFPGTNLILFNPKNFGIRQKMGKGDGWIYHSELTVVHEIGHSLYSSLLPTERKQWLNIGGWRKGWRDGQAPAYVERRPGWEQITSTWTHKQGLKLPRYYTEKNPNECFADCFAYYILGKAHQLDTTIKSFMDEYITNHVKKYPKVSIESPVK